MKTKLFLTLVAIIALCSFMQPAAPKFLFLNAAQLKSLGIELNVKGVFYKNFNPNWSHDQRKYQCLSFYCCNDNYVTSRHYNETDKFEPKSKADRSLMLLPTSRNTFYPLLIGNTKGDMSLDNSTLSPDMKLLPIAVCMAETKLDNRKDTIVIWMKPTHDLQKALPAGIKMDKYVQIPVKSKKIKP